MFLLGADNWRNTPNIRPEIKRFLKWVLEFDEKDRLLGWSQKDYEKISPKDTMLFYGCLFSHHPVFSLACLYLWKQLPETELITRLTTGGLARLEPVAFLNVLRIYMINQEEKGWRNWTFRDLIPLMTDQE